MLSFPISKDYKWELTAGGQPDMRKANNRQNVCDMVKRLHRELEHTTRENKVLKAKNILDKEDEPSCAICMDSMKGCAILHCGHRMCAECFAQHARNSNACPFCRNEFAPKPKPPPEPIPDEVIHMMALLWATEHTAGGYFKRMEEELSLRTDPGEREAFLIYVVRENSKLLMRKVASWYDAHGEV